MKTETNCWHYKWYKFASETCKDKGERGSEDFFVYWCRTLLRAPLIVTMIFAFVTLTPILAVLITIMMNFVTVPLGYGITLVFPGKEFLRFPFRYTTELSYPYSHCSSHYESRVSLSRIIIPVWIIVGIVFLPWFFVSIVIGTIITILSVTVALSASYAFAKEKIGEQSDRLVAEGWRFAKLYLKAKKEKIFPPIEFAKSTKSQILK